MQVYYQPVHKMAILDKNFSILEKLQSSGCGTKIELEGSNCKYLLQ